MKKLFFLLVLGLSLGPARAQDSTLVDTTPVPLDTVAPPASRRLSSDAPRRNWAVGFRIGEPLGINLRKYIGTERKVAFDLNVGTFGGLWASERRHGGREYRNTGLSVNAQVLAYRDFGKSGNLQGYYGFGGQANRRREYPQNNLDVSFRRTVTLGLNALVGLEYRIPQRPISIFAETGAYAEIILVPIWLHIQGGAGARFHF
jgi:hypothetical protein